MLMALSSSLATSASSTMVQTVPGPSMQAGGPSSDVVSSANSTPNSVSAQTPSTDVPRGPIPAFEPTCYLPYDAVIHVQNRKGPEKTESELPNAVTFLPDPVVDFTVDDIPRDVDCLRDGVQAAVMKRLLSDTQPREERVNPVLLKNSHTAKAANTKPSFPSCDALIAEVMTGTRREATMTTFNAMKDALTDHFTKRNGRLQEKKDTLQDQYLAMHQKWKTMCHLLDEELADIPVEIEPTPPPQPPPPPPPVIARATRRAIATGEFAPVDILPAKSPQPTEQEKAEALIRRADKNRATIPDMIVMLDVDSSMIRYNNTNLPIDDTDAYFAPHTGIHDWTEEEKEILLTQYLQHPKQFGIIAEHLAHKTAAQCVAYYYLHKKHLIDFRNGDHSHGRGRRTRTSKQKANALLADIRQHDALLEMEGRVTRSRTSTVAPEPRRAPSFPSRKVPTPVASAASTPEPEGRPKRKRAAQPSSRSQVIDLDTDTEDEPVRRGRPAKKQKKQQRYKSAAIIEDDDESAPPTPSPLPEIEDMVARKRPAPSNFSSWSEDDKQLFLKLVSQHGEDFKRIASSMPNKTTLQVTNFFKSNYVELNLGTLAASAPGRSPTPSGVQTPNRRNDTQHHGSTIMTGVTDPSASSMSVLNFGSQKPSFQQATTGSFYKSRDDPRNLGPNTFTLDKNGDLRFQVKPMPSSSTAPSSSNSTPPMDFIDPKDAPGMRAESSSTNLASLLHGPSTWSRFTQPITASSMPSNSKSSPGFIVPTPHPDSFIRTNAEHSYPTAAMPTFSALFPGAAANIQAYGQPTQFQAPGRPFAYPYGYSLYPISQRPPSAHIAPVTPGGNIASNSQPLPGVSGTFPLVRGGQYYFPPTS